MVSVRNGLDSRTNLGYATGEIVLGNGDTVDATPFTGGNKVGRSKQARSIVCTGQDGGDESSSGSFPFTACNMDRP